MAQQRVATNMAANINALEGLLAAFHAVHGPQTTAALAFCGHGRCRQAAEALDELHVQQKHSAGLEAENRRLQIDVASLRCTHRGIGLPLCRVCDSRTEAEGGPQAVEAVQE